jgi:hypothetical protein
VTDFGADLPLDVYCDWLEDRGLDCRDLRAWADDLVVPYGTPFSHIEGAVDHPEAAGYGSLLACEVGHGYARPSAAVSGFAGR